MPQNKKQDLYNLALKGGKDSELFLLDKLHSLEEEFNERLEKKIERLVSEKIKEKLLGNSTLDIKLTGISQVKGDKGDSPTGKELLALIRPLIPVVEDGHTPTDEELLVLIKPLIPEVEDGHTPTNEELLDLIKPLIPIVKDGSPDKPEEIRDKLETLKDEDRLDKDAIKGLKELLEEIKKSSTIVGGGGRVPRYIKFSFSGNDSTTVFTLPHVPAGKGLALWAYYNNAWLQPSVGFTVSGLTFTTLFTPANGTFVEGFLQTQ